jgi:hypothetical protein
MVFLFVAYTCGAYLIIRILYNWTVALKLNHIQIGCSNSAQRTYVEKLRETKLFYLPLFYLLSNKGCCCRLHSPTEFVLWKWRSVQLFPFNIVRASRIYSVPWPIKIHLMGWSTLHWGELQSCHSRSTRGVCQTSSLRNLQGCGIQSFSTSPMYR